MIRNKAARLNRNLMYAMVLMGLVIVGCAYAFLYLALPADVPQEEQVEMMDSLLINEE